MPDASPQKVWQAIREHRDESAVLLAGHEPLFSATVAYLLGSTQEMIHFRKGALVRIDADAVAAAPRGILEWMITARLA